MPAKPGQKMVGAYMDGDLAERFTSWARGTEGGTSAALRRIVADAVDGKQPVAPAGAGQGQQVSVRMRPPERALLAEVAKARATSPANWLRSLAIAHLARKPQWNSVELDALRTVARELASIGNNVNQIARALNVAVHTGQYPPHQGLATKEAAEAVRYEMRRVAAMITGNFDYWGCPMDERPEPVPDAEARDTQAAQAAEKKRKGRPTRRPARFADGEA